MREPWIQRKFPFDYPVERSGVFVSRLRGTTCRIHEAVRGLSAANLAARDGRSWSIQEHVGHLFDLDELHLRRIEELANGKEQLSAADMDNQATWNAKHNERSFAAVFDRFLQRRQQLIQTLRQLDHEGLGRVGQHPRLQTPMRAVDVACFAAEHDDHHIAKIEQLAATSTHPPAKADCKSWSDMSADTPVDLLERRRIIGFDAMISHLTLRQGCTVPVHAHKNEQFACVLSGKVRFTLADGEQRVLAGGDVLHLPGGAPHGAEVIETAVLLDIFAPPSETTGIDE